MTYAPSIYEYRSEAEWEQAMREWCSENEPKDGRRYTAKVKDADGRQSWHGFDTAEERRAWIAAHPELAVIRLDVEARYHVPAQPKAPAGAPDHLDGGSRADYRMAGYNRY